MPDEAPRLVDQTNPGDAGHTTTEFKLTVAAMVIGTLLEGSVIPILNSLKDSYPNALWIAAVLGICGVAVQIVSLFGYQKSRATVKTALAMALGDGRPSSATVDGQVLARP